MALENHLIFGGEILLLGFYGMLLVLVPLVRAIGGGELPIELTARGARFAESAAEVSVATSQEIAGRVDSLEGAMAYQEVETEEHARQVTEGMHDLEGELAALRGRFDKFERKLRGTDGAQGEPSAVSKNRT